MKRVCVLTGASGALGTAFIKRFSAQYDFVAIHNRHDLAFATQNQSFIDPLAPSTPLRQNEHPVFAIRSDLANEEAIHDLCVETLERFHRVDVLINAAVHRRYCHLLHPTSLSDADLAFRVNALAPLRLALGFARLFWKDDPSENIQQRRNIVNVSSTAGVYVYPDAGQTIYGACKAALNHATYHLASELWDIGIRVNAVAPNTFPGLVATERVLDKIAALDNSDDTGRLVVIDQG